MLTGQWTAVPLKSQITKIHFSTYTKLLRYLFNPRSKHWYSHILSLLSPRERQTTFQVGDYIVMLRVLQTSLFDCAGDCMIRGMKEQRDKIWSRGGWKEITNGWYQNDEKSKQLQQNVQISAVWWPPGRILRPVAGHIPLGRHQPCWDPAAGILPDLLRILPGLLRILPGHHNQPCLLVRRWVCVCTQHCTLN